MKGRHGREIAGRINNHGGEYLQVLVLPKTQDVTWFYRPDWFRNIESIMDHMIVILALHCHGIVNSLLSFGHLKPKFNWEHFHMA